MCVYTYIVICNRYRHPCALVHWICSLFQQTACGNVLQISVLHFVLEPKCSSRQYLRNGALYISSVPAVRLWKSLVFY